MRITLVIQTLGAGGAEKVIVALANFWARSGHQVSLVSFADIEPYFEVANDVRLHLLGLPALRGKTFGALLTLFSRVFRLRRVLREHDPDFVVSFLTKVNGTVALAAAGLPIRLIVSERNNPQMQQFNPVWRGLRAVCYRICDRIVVMTSGVGSALPAHAADKIRVIPNMVYPKAARRRDLAAGDKVTFVATGRLVEQKGFDLLLKAFAKINRQYPRTQLRIFGEGHLEGELTRLRDRLGLQEAVTFMGVSSRPEEWTEAGEIFVLSSRYEGFGNVVCEAMQAGMAVIAFDCPWGPGEIIEHGASGIVVPAEDVERLADAMAQLLDDPDMRQRLGERAVSSVEQFYPERVLVKWDELLAEFEPGLQGNDVMDGSACAMATAESEDREAQNGA